jgi:hypothetical protein
MNFSNKNRYSTFCEEDEGETLFKSMKPKKKKTDEERFKFKSYTTTPEKIKEFTMETSAFPELSSSSKKSNDDNIKEVKENKNFLLTLKNTVEITKKEETLPCFNTNSDSNCVIITLNKSTGQFTFSGRMMMMTTHHEEDDTVDDDERTTDARELKRESKLVIKALTDLHMRRTREYIKMWGLDEHYRTFYSSISSFDY